MGVVLRFNDQELELPEGEFVIGRGETCQLSIADPLASRRHAAIVVVGGGARLLDLDSANGVKLNGKAVEDAVLSHGDVIRIGRQDLTVLIARERRETLRKRETERFDVFGVAGSLAEKAFKLGHTDEAETLLAPHLERALERAAELSQSSSETYERALGYALRLARVTTRGRWFDYAIALQARASRLPAQQTLDELLDVVRKVDRVDLDALRAYAAAWNEQSSKLSASDRFVLSRVESLARTAASR